MRDESITCPTLKARLQDIEIGLVLSCTAILLLQEWDRDKYIDIYPSISCSWNFYEVSKYCRQVSTIHIKYIILPPTYTSHMISRGKTRMLRPERGIFVPPDHGRAQMTLLQFIYARRCLLSIYVDMVARRSFYITQEWQEEYISLKSSRQKEQPVKFD